jgi:hypothetical protein
LILTRRAIAAVLASATITAGVRAHDLIGVRVTWAGDVERIVKARCITCHREGGAAPMPLTTYAEARPWAKAIKEEVLTRRMPKWHAVRGYGDFANDPSLSPFEIALIAAWADGGAPRGSTTASSGDSETPPDAPTHARTREIALSCGEDRLPEGVLVGVRPLLARGASLGIAVQSRTRLHIVAWIRDFDPKFTTTYWLRTPLTLAGGSRLRVRLDGGTKPCRIDLIVVPPR